VDLLKRRAIRAGKRIDLTAKEFALLELLMRRRGEVLPKSLIASQVWDMNFDSDTNVIEVAVRRVRAKIDDDFEPKLIQTVRGMGYMMDAGMTHDDPNSVLIEPGAREELIWTFSKTKNLEFACNIPGHYQAGMVGKVEIR